MRHRPVICILDNDKDRCLREEKALEAAIRDKCIAASGISNFGPNHLARSGVETFPCIDVDGVYFTPKAGTDELTYEILCDFLDMLVRKKIIGAPQAPAE